ncbi:hypothetical protein Patl1_04862 [Pistacia atlantica]|uniref:Uncharacterized protein n=1 Tax=Pistacia atlantica TaxID=434234 RepID=A0ACC1BPX6_9ROSI|nr:hypothetical protein Patl1_04862 [Pistacia atlantica]
MRRALLGETEGTCITRAKSEKIPHEYSTIVGIQESVHEILMNLKEIVLRSNIYGTRDALICVKGPGYRNRGYNNIKRPNNFQDGSYPIDAVFMPVRNANHSIHSYGNGNEKQEILFLEIWTNGSLTPKEALHEASRNLIDLFIPFLQAAEENFHLEHNQYKVTLPFFTWCDNISVGSLASNPVYHARTKHIEIDAHYIREQVLAKKLTVQYVPSSLQIANILTKALSTAQFALLTQKLTISLSPRQASNNQPLNNSK